MKGCDGPAAASSSLPSKTAPEARCATIEIVVVLRRTPHLVAIVTEITATYTTFINMEMFTVIPMFSLDILQPKTLVELWGAMMLRRRFVATIA
jgi:hypothetical protein